MLHVQQHLARGAVPFLIRWGDVAHLGQHRPLDERGKPRQVRQRLGEKPSEDRRQVWGEPDRQRLGDAWALDIGLLGEMLPAWAVGP